MANLTLRLVKGVPLTNAEVDSNFSNLNIYKAEIGRDLSGNIYYPVVSGIQGRDIASTTPSNAQVLTWLTASNAWAPASIIIPEVPVTVANILLTGDVSGSANAVLTAGSTIFSISTTIQPNSVALGTDTTGPYVSNITVGSGLTVSGTADEGNVVTLAHADTSSVTNVSSDNSDGTVIQDISLGFDTFGHVTSASVATVNLDSRFVRLSTASLQTVTGPVNFEGNITFAGNVTTIAANNLIITDNFIYLNDGDSNSNIDFGFVGNYNDGTYQHAGFFRDASDNGTWKVFEGYLPEPDAAVDIDTSNTSFRLANLAVNKLTVNDIISGNILPSANLTYNLGSPSLRFKDLYLSGTTINLGAAVLSATADSVSISAIDNTPIGETTRSTGKFTNLNANVITGNIFSGIIQTTVGTCNFFAGADAGSGNTTGCNNIFIGAGAGSCNTFSCYNVFLGYEAGKCSSSNYSERNIFIGYRSGQNSGSYGKYNVFLGSCAGACNGFGSYNTFLGTNAGLRNNSDNNVFIGTIAGCSNTGGYKNTFLGMGSGVCNTNGCCNTFVGASAGFETSEGAQNSFFGTESGSCHTTGIRNTFLGYRAGGNISTGSDNLILGCLSSCVGLTANTSNIIILATAGTERLKVDNGNLSVEAGAGNIISSQGFFNNLIIKNVSEYVANTATFATTTESTIFEFSKDVYSSGKFTITGKQGSNVQISEMLVAQDGTTASATEYGVVKTSVVTVFTGNVDISGNNVRVRVIGGSAISTKYTLAGTLLDL